MSTVGLGGSPRGPEFISPPPHPLLPDISDKSVGPRWRLLALAGLLGISASAVTGGTAGFLAGRGSDAAPAPVPAPPAGVPSDLVAAAARALPGVVSVQVRTGSGGASGSGFVLDDRGHIVTNHHVVAGAGSVSVVGSDGRRLTAEVVGTDPGSDIAVLRVTPGPALQPLVLADPRGVRVGEPVLAVGSPLGLSGTVTAGIVSAVDRQVRLGGSTRQSAVQTDASINPGNSGGPLINARGEVIGVNTAIATLEGGGSIGIGFAVPVDRAREVAAGLIGRG
ncbi:trypsin-like peptidase domain-containing protein [Actinoplanes sp. NPDC051861]|uniref:S1C family serine protease n=1 Tax=Actinoplanes sp. NPDC051861 TaxID=3155170 RepID=UPI0034161501